jgi:hypothetical protein
MYKLLGCTALTGYIMLQYSAIVTSLISSNSHGNTDYVVIQPVKLQFL